MNHLSFISIDNNCQLTSAMLEAYFRCCTKYGSQRRYTNSRSSEYMRSCCWAWYCTTQRHGHWKNHRREDSECLKWRVWEQLKIRNTDIRSRLGCTHDIIHRIQQRRLRYFGHISRMANYRYRRTWRGLVKELPLRATASPGH